MALGNRKFEIRNSKFEIKQRSCAHHAYDNQKARDTRDTFDTRDTSGSRLRIPRGGKIDGITRTEIETFLKLLAPFAPHMTEELWQFLRNSKLQIPRLPKPGTGGQANSKFSSIHHAPWPKFDPKLAEASQIVLVVQVNGKVRDRISVERGISQ